MIINTPNLQTVFQAYKGAFQMGFESAATTWERVATLINGTALTFEYGFLGQFPQLRQWIGDRQIKSMQQYVYRVENVPYEGTIGVPRRLIEADQHGILTPVFQAHGEAARTHPDALVWAALAAGTASLCYDGQYFFDTDHPENGASVSNTGGGGGTAWYLMCTNRFLKPLIFQQRKEYGIVSQTDPSDPAAFMRGEYLFGVDGDCAPAYGMWQMAYHSKQTLDETGYTAARAAIMSRMSDQGRPLGLVPNLLVVPPSLEVAARKLVVMTTLANGAQNPLAGTADVLVSPYLS